MLNILLVCSKVKIAVTLIFIPSLLSLPIRDVLNLFFVLTIGIFT